MDQQLNLMVDKFYSLKEIKSKNNIVTVNWKMNISEDYMELSSKYYKSGYIVLQEVICSGHDNRKTDMWFIAGLFLLRQSIELGLKALIARVFDNTNTQSIFKECGHNLMDLFIRYYEKSEDYITNNEKSWLMTYLTSIEEIDRNSDLLRFPFEDEFLKQYKNKYVDVVYTSKNLVQANLLIKKCLSFGEYNHFVDYDSNLTPTFLILANHGIGNCHLWEPISDKGFQTKIRGYVDVSDYLYNSKELTLDELLFPLIFLLRNSIELCLKRIFFSSVDNGVPYHLFMSKRRSHLLKKELWKNVRPVIEFYGNARNYNVEYLNKSEELIEELDKLDKKGDRFRYPTTYGLEYYHKEASFDLDNIYSCLRSLISFLDGCNNMLVEIEDFESDMRNYYSDYL